MTAHRVCAALLITLAAIAGCKKKSTDGAGDAQPDPTRAPNIPGLDLGRLGVTIPAPAFSSARTLTDTFDKMAEDIAQDKEPYRDLWGLTKHLPKAATVGGIGSDATAQRTEIDASFAKFWTAWESIPERMRQKRVRDQADRLTKQGMAPDAARVEAGKQNQRMPPLPVTAPNPDLRGNLVTHIEADIPNGVKDRWEGGLGLRVTGSVQYSESLQLHSLDLTVKLRGRAGTLGLHASVAVVADLVELNAPVVEVDVNGGVFLRVGPGTNTVRLKGIVRSGTILTRGNSGLKVEVADRRHDQLAVVAY